MMGKVLDDNQSSWEAPRTILWFRGFAPSGDMDPEDYFLYDKIEED
jgi:hypothetical protein